MDVCVIGGSRYFGKRLIGRLLAAGHRVTVVNRGSAPPPEGTTALIADRGDAAALRTALAGSHFDVVVDQVCYTPAQAAVAASVFAGRADRYVMTSTIEVYADRSRPTAGPPLAEAAAPLDPGAVDLSAPWHDPAYLEAHYGPGKLQAETVLSEAGSFDFASVRSAHVLGGADFTGRLAHYVDRVGAGRSVEVHDPEFGSTYIGVDEIAGFLAWSAEASFTGPVNANSHGVATARELCALIPGEARFTTVRPDAAASPFSFATHYPMDNSRAESLGFAFSNLSDWLPAAIDELLSER